MENEDGSEDRLTKNEFAELVQHLSVQEVLAIEYRIGTTWNKLFLRKNVQPNTFYCNLCLLETSSFKNLLAHIDGKKHKLRMEKVDQLYHQDYTYPKTNKKDNSSDEKTLENVDESGSNLEKPTPDLTTKNNACLKSSTVVENKIDKSEKNCEHENTKDKETSQENLNSEVVKKGDNKQAVATPTVNPARKSVEEVFEKSLSVESSNDEEIDLKKPKIVINPAAALSLKKNSIKNLKPEENIKKPEYQTDRIIIPTAQKSKQSEQSSQPSGLQSQDNVAPKFAMKSYSSKPSDNDVHGILGVEYVIKILKSRYDISPRYECGLCELVFDGFVMQRHLEGYNHRLKFCEKHFPTAIRQYRHYMQEVPEEEIFKVMTPVLAKLACAIEEHHGRNLPYECFERDYNLNRHEILAKAFSCRHASEQYGPTFTHVVSSKEIDEFINNRQNYMPPPFSRTAIFDSNVGSINNKPGYRHQNRRVVDKEHHLSERQRHTASKNVPDGTFGGCRSYMPSNLQNNMYAPFTSYTQPDNRNAIQPVDDATYNLMVDDFLKGTLKGTSRNSLSNTRKRPFSSIQNSSSEKPKSQSPLHQDDIWQTYRHLVDQELDKLQERYEQYRNEPESHPAYNEEWQKFWKRRKDELVSAGLDHRNYNYQPEWVRFVKVRIEELYDEEIESAKRSVRERLCLPMSNEKITETKYHLKLQQTISSNDTVGTEYEMQESAETTDSSTTSQTRHNNTPQVVSVLRLMTALEDSLGSLGPKIIDLLSKALQTEKINPLHVNSIILNDENCSLIELAKEKLKGLVITGLFEGSKKKVLKQVVTDAEVLLNYAYQFKTTLPSQRSLTDPSINRPHNNSSFSLDNISAGLKNQSGSSNFLNKTTTSSITDNILPSIQKKELASKLAASLVAQGKAEFDPSQLQQLIAVYKLIEKKKRETGGTLQSNKSYLQDSSSVSKKTLSDTLSDLLKPSSSSGNVTSNVATIFKTSNDATTASNSDLRSSVVPGTFTYNAPRNSFTSVLQNPRDNFFNNTALSMPNKYGANNVGGNPIEQQNDYPKNYTSSMQPNQRNYAMGNTYSQFQNNSRMTQNWGWNANSNANQNYNMSNANNRLDQNSNWQQF